MRKILLLGVSSLLAVSAYSQAIPSYLLENDAAHRYLTEVSYKSDDYTCASYMECRRGCGSPED